MRTSSRKQIYHTIKCINMKNLLIIFTLLLALPNTVSAQKFLDKVLKGVEKTNKILDETDKILGTGDNTSSSGNKNSRTKGFQIVSPHPDLTVQITRCKGTGNTVIIDFLLTFEGEDGKIRFNDSSSKAFDDLGNEYQPDNLIGGNGDRYSSTFLPADVAVKCHMRIEGVKSQATMFKRVNIYAGLTNDIMIYNLPITWKDNSATLPPSEPETVSTSDAKETLESTKEIDEDFDVFEDKFIGNSRFQTARIKFDNLGYNADGEKWTRENWNILKNKPSSMENSKQYKYDQTLSDKQCVQKIWIPDSDFLLEYTYSKMNGKWYLIKVIERF